MYRSPEKISNVSDALARSRWRERAACADSDDPDLWFYQPGSRERGNLSSLRELEAYLTCGTCPVRTNCLEDALTTWIVPVGDGRTSHVWATGTWGATSLQDRTEVRSLPIPAAAEVLEAGLPERLEARIAVFERLHPVGPHRRCLGGKCRRARALLDAMRAKIGAEDPAA